MVRCHRCMAFLGQPETHDCRPKMEKERDAMKEALAEWLELWKGYYSRDNIATEDSLVRRTERLLSDKT